VRALDNLEWVPIAAKVAAKRLLASAESEDKRDLIERLLTDQKGENVWKEIWKHRGFRPRDPWFGQFKSPHDVATGAFFEYAYFYAHVGIQTDTHTHLAEISRPILGTVERLRKEAEYIRIWVEPADSAAEQLGHVAAIEAAADFFERDTLQVLKAAAPYSVDRNQGDPRRRAYVLLMSDKARELFGTWMYKTIATVTNVALNKGAPVSKDKVRDWLRLRHRGS
jgi:hypothetical protein